MTSWNAKMEVQRWNRQMANVPRQLRDAALEANTKSQLEHERRLRRATPLGAEGGAHIRDTIETGDGDANLMEKYVKIGSTGLPYAIPLEFGHRTKSGKLVRGVRFFRAVRSIMRKKHRNRSRSALRKALKAAFPG